MARTTLPRLTNSDQCYSWTSDRLGELLAEGDRARAEITPETWPDERKQRRARLAQVLVPDWPKPDPKVTFTGTIERSAWTIHKLMFQSLPDYWVTAHLYLPHGVTANTPAMLVASGHILEAKSYSEYHGISEELARQGMVVLSFDPVSQGERVQNWNHLRDEIDVGWGTTEHDFLGLKALLAGWPLAQAIVWDGMRALDVLLARPEVDPTRVGMCGVSGGGTQTTWQLAADDRLTCASPACFITGWREQFDDHLGADPEQHPYPVISWGWDQCDVLLSFAPKPIMITCVTQDFFPIEGTRTTHRKLSEVYDRLGVGGNVAISETDMDHAYHPPVREATVRWFAEQFGLEYDEGGPAKDPCAPEELQVTPSGQLFTSGFGYTLHDWIVKRRPHPVGANMGEETRHHRLHWTIRRRELLEELLAIPSRRPSIGERRVGELPLPDGSAEQWIVESEPGVEVPVLLALPTDGQRGVVLHTHELGAEVDWQRHDGPMHKLMKAGWAVVSVDPRGTGPSVHGEESKAHNPRFGTEQHLTWTWTMMGRPLIGQRVLDLLQVEAWACHQTELAGLPVAAVGAGAGAMLALLAGALDTRIDQVVAYGGLSDFGRMLTARTETWDASAIVPNMLRWGDLPQVVALIAPRSCTLVAPVDAERRPVPMMRANSAYRAVEKFYEAYDAPTFHIVGAGEWPERLAVDYSEWLHE